MLVGDGGLDVRRRLVGSGDAGRHVGVSQRQILQPQQILPLAVPPRQIHCFAQVLLVGVVSAVNGARGPYDLELLFRNSLLTKIMELQNEREKLTFSLLQKAI